MSLVFLADVVCTISYVKSRSHSETQKGIEFHRRNVDDASGVWALVSVDLAKLSGKSRRVNITMPEKLLALVDQHAKKHGETRSGFIAQAAMEFIANHSTVEG